jgi:CTP:molybdopterin cytidylyltransferase MocA
MRGADKLLEPVDGVPLLERQTRAALASGANVLVTVSRDFPSRARVLQGITDPGLSVSDDIDGREGMAVSLRAGALAAQQAQATGLMILPADMPEITAANIAAMLAAFRTTPQAVHRATSAQGIPGHPVLFPARLFDALSRVSGDQGARDVLTGEALRLTALPDDHALVDLDTPEDWAAWRKVRSGASGLA